MIESLVREQYVRSVDILERGRLTDGVIIPSEAECIDILRDTLTDAQITHIQEKMRRAVFQIVPQKPFVDFMNAMNLLKKPEARLNSHLSPYVSQRFAKMPSNNEVRIGFVEGNVRLPGTALIMFPMVKQEEIYKRSLPEGVSVIHPRNYALLQCDRTIDVNHASVLEDNSEDRTYFPGAQWERISVEIVHDIPNDWNKRARWRSQIMKVVQ